MLPAAAVFGLLSMLRSLLYRIGLLRTHQLPVPVVVVGNLIVGGAGKTPTVMAVVRLLRENGFRPGIVSRGYRRDGDSVVDVEPGTPVTRCGDEPLLMRLRTGAPVMVGRDRAEAGRELLRHHPEVNLIVSDDGLQHRRLARRAQVIVFDERGAGNGWVLPAGPLREPVPRALPPRTVVLYNARKATTELPGSVARQSLAGVVALPEWWQGEPASQAALDGLKGRQLIAAAGMARPQRFFDMLRERGLNIEPLALPDHHDYRALPWPATAADVVVTEKDAVKLAPDRMGRTRVWVAALDFSTTPEFDSALLALLPSPTNPPREKSHGSPTA